MIVPVKKRLRLPPVWPAAEMRLRRWTPGNLPTCPGTPPAVPDRKFPGHPPKRMFTPKGLKGTIG